MNLNSPELLKAISEMEKGDYSAAITLLVPLADAGNPRAQCHLAHAFHLGLGVEADGKKACELYQKVADQNIQEGHLSALAFNNLATLYFVGAPGVGQDREKGRLYLARARELGFAM